MDGYQGQCNRLYGTLLVHLKRQSPVAARAFFWMQCLRMALWYLISEPEMVLQMSWFWSCCARMSVTMSMLKKLLRALRVWVSESDNDSSWFGESMVTVTWGSLQMRHGQQALCPYVAGWGASVSNIAMKRDGGPWVVESVPGRVWWQIDQIGQSLPLFKIWCRVRLNSPGRYTPQHGRWTWRVFRRALCKVFNEVWCGECQVRCVQIRALAWCQKIKNLKWHQQGVGTCGTCSKIEWLQQLPRLDDVGAWNSLDVLPGRRYALAKNWRICRCFAISVQYCKNTSNTNGMGRFGTCGLRNGVNGDSAKAFFSEDASNLQWDFSQFQPTFPSQFFRCVESIDSWMTRSPLLWMTTASPWSWQMIDVSPSGAKTVKRVQVQQRVKTRCFVKSSFWRTLNNFNIHGNIWEICGTTMVIYGKYMIYIYIFLISCNLESPWNFQMLSSSRRVAIWTQMDALPVAFREVSRQTGPRALCHLYEGGGLEGLESIDMLQDLKGQTLLCQQIDLRDN